MTEIACNDDAYVNGALVDSVTGMSGFNGPSVAAKGKGSVMVLDDDVHSGSQVVAEFKKVFYPILNGGVTPAPNAGRATATPNGKRCGALNRHSAGAVQMKRES